MFKLRNDIIRNNEMSFRMEDKKGSGGGRMVGSKVSQIANIFKAMTPVKGDGEVVLVSPGESPKTTTEGGVTVVRTESHVARFNNARALFEKLGTLQSFTFCHLLVLKVAQACRLNSTIPCYVIGHTCEKSTFSCTKIFVKSSGWFLQSSDNKLIKVVMFVLKWFICNNMLNGVCFNTYSYLFRKLATRMFNFEQVY